MPRFVLHVMQPGEEAPAPAVLASIMRDVAEVTAAMQSAGVWVLGAGLTPPSRAIVVRVDATGSRVTDGPYLETREHVGGFTVVDVASDAEARRWAERLARATTLPVEVRACQPQ